MQIVQINEMPLCSLLSTLYRLRTLLWISKVLLQALYMVTLHSKNMSHMTRTGACQRVSDSENFASLTVILYKMPIAKIITR